MKIDKNVIKNYHDAVEFIDYLILSLEAGHNIQKSFFWSTMNISPGHFQNDCFEVLKCYQLGHSFAHSLVMFSNVNFSEVAVSIFENLVIGMRYGSSMTETLSRLSAQLKLTLMSKLEELAHEAPVKMIFPLVIFIFPVLFILLGTKTFLDFILSLGA